MRAVVLAVVLSLLPIAWGGAVAAPSCVERTGDVPADRRPVVLVHGWMGDPMAPVAGVLEQRLGSRVSTFTFDYRARAMFWASDDSIAGCLAAFVGGVAEVHRNNGGDGKVVVVAHSMGGLAIRYALRGQSDAVSEVITVGTPALGSPWGNTALATGYASAHAQGRETPEKGAATGATCLAKHADGAPLVSGCGDLPPWLPAATRVTQIAGDVSIDRYLFGFRIYSLPLSSDGIVPVSSALGYARSGPGSPPGAKTVTASESCRVDHGVLGRALSVAFAGRAGTVAAADLLTLPALQEEELSPTAIAYLLEATKFAPCSHSNQLGDEKVLTRLVAAVSQAATPVKRAVLADGYDGIKLGMTAAEAIKASKVALTQRTSGVCTYLQGPAPQDVFALLNRSGRVLGVRIPRGGKTEREVGVGSTFAAVRQAYAGSPMEEGYSVSGYFVTVTGTSGTLGFLSGEPTGTVEDVRVGTMEFARAYELCSGMQPPE